MRTPACPADRRGLQPPVAGRVRETNLAEVAFVVHDSWQNRGVGTFLLRYLIRIARRHGIRGFTAEVLSDNKAMQAVFNKSNCKVRTRYTGNVYSCALDFE
jgi:GNAT superfamily N-acetyltransferase